MADIISLDAWRMKKKAVKTSVDVGHVVTVSATLLVAGIFLLAICVGAFNMVLGEFQRAFANIAIGFVTASTIFAVLLWVNICYEKWENKTMPFDGDAGRYMDGGGGTPEPLSLSPYVAGFLQVMTLVFGTLVIHLFEDGEAAILDSVVLFLLVLIIAVLRSKPAK